MKPIEKKLIKLFNRLAAPEREMLLAFAEFLTQRSDSVTAAVVQKPQLIPRPEKESVVAALKRLSASYPMLDNPALLNEGSTLMSQHVIQGRDANDVINDLELMFERHYELYVKEHDATAGEEGVGC